MIARVGELHLGIRSGLPSSGSWGVAFYLSFLISAMELTTLLGAHHTVLLWQIFTSVSPAGLKFP